MEGLNEFPCHEFPAQGWEELPQRHRLNRAMCYLLPDLFRHLSVVLCVLRGKDTTQLRKIPPSSE